MKAVADLGYELVYIKEKNYQMQKRFRMWI